MTELPDQPIPGQLELPLDYDDVNEWYEDDDFFIACDCEECVEANCE